MSLSQLIGPCWIIRLESALISPAQFCITAQQEQAGETWPRCPWLRWGFVSLPSTLIPAWQGRTQGDGSKAAAARLQTPQRGVGKGDGLGGAGAEAWMCQAMEHLLIKADGKQMWEWEDSWEAQSNLELCSCEIGPTDHSWGWRRREIKTGRNPLWL